MRLCKLSGHETTMIARDNKKHEENKEIAIKTMYSYGYFQSRK